MATLERSWASSVVKEVALIRQTDESELLQDAVGGQHCCEVSDWQT